ncbi:hypothetical protein SNARM312S_01023 [Streptomyces narbonensis]
MPSPPGGRAARRTRRPGGALGCAGRSVRPGPTRAAGRRLPRLPALAQPALDGIPPAQTGPGRPLVRRVGRGPRGLVAARRARSGPGRRPHRPAGRVTGRGADTRTAPQRPTRRSESRQRPDPAPVFVALIPVRALARLHLRKAGSHEADAPKWSGHTDGHGWGARALGGRRPCGRRCRGRRGRFAGSDLRQHGAAARPRAGQRLRQHGQRHRAAQPGGRQQLCQQVGRARAGWLRRGGQGRVAQGPARHPARRRAGRWPRGRVRQGGGSSNGGGATAETHTEGSPASSPATASSSRSTSP